MISGVYDKSRILSYNSCATEEAYKSQKIEDHSLRQSSIKGSKKEPASSLRKIPASQPKQLTNVPQTRLALARRILKSSESLEATIEDATNRSISTRVSIPRNILTSGAQAFDRCDVSTCSSPGEEYCLLLCGWAFVYLWL